MVVRLDMRKDQKVLERNGADGKKKYYLSVLRRKRLELLVNYFPKLS